MKKIILTLILSLFAVNVYALENCKDWEIEEGVLALEKLTFSLEYDSQAVDMNGDFDEGNFKITFPNLPTGYYVRVDTSRGDYYSHTPSDIIYSHGGVSQVKIYKDDCEGVIKSFEIKVPFYKQYCLIDKNCNENVWFDGSYENNASNQEQRVDNKISIKLIIILVVLIAIVVGCIVFAIRKRRFDAQDL